MRAFPVKAGAACHTRGTATVAACQDTQVAGLLTHLQLIGRRVVANDGA